MAKPLWDASLGLFLMASLVQASIIPPVKLDHNILESNKTISDATMRKLLDSLKNYLDPVQPVPDEGYLYNSTSAYIKAQMNGTQVTDLTNYKIDVAHADMEKLVFEVGLTFAAVNLTGHYNLSVDNSLLHLLGNGSFNVNITQCQISMNLTLDLNSNKTLEMKDVSTDFNFGDVHVNFENLGEDPDVSSFLNDFINQFIQDSMTSLKPYEQGLIKEQVIKLGNFFVMGQTVGGLVDWINSLV